MKKITRTHCSRGHELTEANVYRAPDGRRYECRTCQRARHRAHYERNREAVLATRACYRAENRERLNEKDRVRRAENVELFRARCRQRYANNPEHHRARARRYYHSRVKEGCTE